MRASRWLVVAGLLTFATSGAFAQSYDGGAATNASGLWTMSGAYREAQQFTLSSAIGFDDIRFWHAQTYGGPSSQSFTYAIYSGAAFAPTTTYGSGTTLLDSVYSVGTNGYQNFFRTNLGVAQTSLAAGTYFLELHSNDAVDTYWADTIDGLNPGAPCYSQQLQEGPEIEQCYPDSHPLSMQLAQVGEVPETAPEPAALVLMGTGLLAVAGVAKRRGSS
jgi:hypothetical protein